MIAFDEFYLENGLQVVVHEDHSTPIAVVNLLYKVGSRDESPDKTGFAHLFEHLMFGGSENIPSYDTALQKVGGDNNAFTNPDLTNYYLTVPAVNLETAFWLESDRMLGLSFEPGILEVQRRVVVEEYKQRYLNQPYGDAWLKLRPLVYKVHPYQWPTIGKDITHIENATMDDVKSFFKTYYSPGNAVLVVAGDVNPENVRQLAEKWFGPVQPGPRVERNIPEEPAQTQKRTLETSAEVPMSMLTMAWHMPERLSSNYHGCDLMSDILGRGKSSRLYRHLVKEKKIFNSIQAYISGSIDPGLFIISGKLNMGTDFQMAEEAVMNEIEILKKDMITETEMDKVKTQAEASLAYSQVELLNRAMNLAFFAYLGDPAYYNKEVDKIDKVNIDRIKELADKILCDDKVSVLYYKAHNGST